MLKPPLLPWLFRIVAKARDGTAVTLGKYHSREEAEIDHERMIKAAHYRGIKIVEIEQPPA